MKKFNVTLFFLMILTSCTLLESKTQTTNPTSTSILIPQPTQVLITSTVTNTAIPTITPTFTPIPESSILFQRNFEDDYVGASSKGGIWAIEQELDGNHCMSGSGEGTIWYQRKQTRSADFALEIRVKFIKGQALYIIFPSNVNWSEHYGVAINSIGLSVMRTWSIISNNIPMSLDPSRWYTIRVEIKKDGNSLSIYIDNLLLEDITLQPPVINRDVIGYVINENDEDKVCFDDIKVWSLK